jgi:hypothetical protein
MVRESSSTPERRVAGPATAPPMADLPELSALLNGLDAELERRRVPAAARRDLLAEVAHDLAAAADELDGDCDGAARRRLIRDFGSPATVARLWARADRDEPSRLAWSLLSAAGALLGLAVGAPLGTFVGRLAGADWPVLPIVGVALGLGVGLPQWALLRRRQTGVDLWAPASAAAVALALSVATWIVEHVGLEKGVVAHDVAGLLATGGLVGATLGVLQFRGAFGRRGAGRWAALSGVALGLALPAAGLLALTAPDGFRSPQGQLLLAFLAAGGLGLGTAVGLPSLHAEEPHES